MRRFDLASPPDCPPFLSPFGGTEAIRLKLAGMECDLAAMRNQLARLDGMREFLRAEVAAAKAFCDAFRANRG